MNRLIKLCKHRCLNFFNKITKFYFKNRNSKMALVTLNEKENTKLMIQKEDYKLQGIIKNKMFISHSSRCHGAWR